MSYLILMGVLMGVGGTVAMDIWALGIARAGIAPFPNWAGPGRWTAHLPTLYHNDFNALPERESDVRLGWILHYGVGIAYGIIWAILAGNSWLAAPTFFPVWIFALFTIAAGWFLLQPGMGLGWGASKTPKPWKIRGLGLLAHTAFGVGMWTVAAAL